MKRYDDVDWKGMMKESRLRQKDVCKWVGGVDEAYFSRFLSGEKDLNDDVKEKLYLALGIAIEAMKKIEALKK